MEDSEVDQVEKLEYFLRKWNKIQDSKLEKQKANRQEFIKLERRAIKLAQKYLGVTEKKAKDMIYK